MLFRITLVSILSSVLLACGSEPAIDELRPPLNEDDQICSRFISPAEKAADGKISDYNAYDEKRRIYNTPTRLLEEFEWPRIIDDLDFEGMDLAITRQLKRYKSKNLSGYIRLGGKKYPLEDVPTSLEKFKTLVSRYFRCQNRHSREDCATDFTSDLKNNFNMFAPELTPDDPRYGENKQTLFTAYYTPLLRGRTSPDSRYKHGVYKIPKDKELLKKSRVDIDFKGAFVGSGLENFYADDLFDLYLLHVQGGGRVVMENKSGNLESFYISYAGTNGQSWNFISNYMYEKKYITNKGINAQRDFLLKHPQKQEEIYATCPSYVFFKKTDHPPLGNDMVSLTDNRSIATDTNYYKFKGLLSYIKTKRPRNEDIGTKDDCKQIPYKDYSRFYLDQDTGGAIRGKARVDLYFGEGPYAELAAYNTKERGDLYFLMLK